MGDQYIEMQNNPNQLLRPREGDNATYVDYENVRRQHRTTSMHRNVCARPANATQFRTMPRELEQRRVWVSYDRVETDELEYHADQIAERMAQDKTLNQNNPLSDQLRNEALRSMPQFLAVKRCVKVKLTQSMNLKSKRKGIVWYKRWKYNANIKLAQINSELKSWVSFFEVWYGTLKKIEGHFGSGIASYFKFFRWLFFLNCFIMLVATVFIIVPEIILSEAQNNTEKFYLADVFTGEGSFKNSLLYYGSYSDSFLQLGQSIKYNMSYAYFVTMVVMYGIYLVMFGSKFAASYRKSYIETKSGLKNVFANKIFCAWDYGISTEEGATLKHLALYQELKEGLCDFDKKSQKVKFMTEVQTFFLRLTFNIIVLLTISGIGFMIWKLLEHNKKLTTDSVSIAVVVNICIIVFPIIFNFLSKYEDYKSPRTALYMNLLRLFLLTLVVIGILITYWTESGNGAQKCWETSLGQEVYRLIIFDFVFSVLFTFIFEVCRYFAFKYLWPKLDRNEFDVAAHTLQLVYNQTLFWVGFYFAPLLVVVIVIKLVLIWYIKSRTLLHCCKPSCRCWKATQAQTLFLVLSLICLVVSLMALIYIVYAGDSSNCGPLRKGIKAIFDFDDAGIIWTLVEYIFKPGTLGMIIVAILAAIYYERAKALAQVETVHFLREMLVLEAKDKEYLLAKISKITKGEWQYSLQEGRKGLHDPIRMAPMKPSSDSIQRFDNAERHGGKMKHF